MIQINTMQALMAIIPFLKEEYNDIKTSDWEISDVLSLWFSDPGTWETWRNIIPELLKKQEFIKFKSRKEILLDLDKAFMTIRLFFEKYYWEKDHNTTLDYVVSDINDHINGTIPLEKTEMWSVWIECVQENLKYESLLDKG